MKRVLLGVAWFLGIWVGLILVSSIIIGVWATRSVPAGANAEQGMQAANDFALAHAALFGAVRWGVFLVALLVAGLGTWKGVLPGTRKKPAA